MEVESISTEHVSFAMMATCIQLQTPFRPRATMQCVDCCAGDQAQYKQPDGKHYVS